MAEWSIAVEHRGFESYNPRLVIFLEVWLSGRKRHPARVLAGVIWSEGSNPFASAYFNWCHSSMGYARAIEEYVDNTIPNRTEECSPVWE